MATLETLSTCFGAYHLDSTGFDPSSDRLLDQSGFGNHLDIYNATVPVYRTVGGHEFIDFTNEYYFKGKAAWPPYFSAALVLATTIGVGESGGAAPFATAEGRNDMNDYLVNVDTLTEADVYDGTWRSKKIFLYGLSVGFGDDSGASVYGSSLTSGAPSVFTFAVNRYPSQFHVGRNDELRTIYNPPSDGYLPAWPLNGQWLRLGQLKAALGALTTGWVAAKRLYLFRDNVFDHPSFGLAMAAEMAAFGIT